MIRLRAGRAAPAALMTLWLGCSAAPEDGGSAAGPAGEGKIRAGLAGFSGSDACRDCHDGIWEAWKSTLHARTVHEPTDVERQMLARALVCEQQEARYVLGERHARRFMVPSEAEPGLHVLLPCRYDTGSGEWSSLHESDWKTLTWERHCGACHTTGFSSESLTFTEPGVGCESCHGSRGRHGDFTGADRMVRFAALSSRDEVAVCASCHLQGGTSRTSGLNFAWQYEAGGDLFADYRFDWASLDAPAGDTGPIDVHQKLLVRDHAPGAGAGRWPDLRCTSCHAAHGFESERHTGLPRGDYCHICHEPDGFALKEYDQSCNVCEF